MTVSLQSGGRVSPASKSNERLSVTMNLARLAAERVATKGPVGVLVIGAGKFGSMFLSQAPTSAGLRIAAIADLSPDRARAACRNVGWDEARIAACHFTDDSASAIARDDVDVVVEVTGNPAAGIRHALAAIEHGKHIVMVNVEADVLAGPALARRARAAGTVYSMAYGDQPALVSELVDWARACGFAVVAAGKGTKYLPEFHAVTPDGVWAHYGLTAGRGASRGHEPADVQLLPRRHQVGDRDGGDRQRLRPRRARGRTSLSALRRRRPAAGAAPARRAAASSRRAASVEVVSSLERDGRPVFRDLRWGVYVVVEAPNDYTAACFAPVRHEDRRDRALRRPLPALPPDRPRARHLGAVGGASRRADRRDDATSAAIAVATAKRDLKAGEMLDGEGGYTVWGKAWPATKSLAHQALPIGLAHGVQLTRDVKAGRGRPLAGRGDRRQPGRLAPPRSRGFSLIG